MKVIIAGGRDFDNYKLMDDNLSEVLGDYNSITVISGTAKGADKLGEKWAFNNGHDVARYPAEWHKYGRSAGFKRNAVMADNADMLIAFWDGKSKGTNHMIKLATDLGLNVITIGY